MGLLETDVDNIVKALRRWSPGSLASERDYEDGAYRYLNGEFPSEKFERQYWRGKTRADIHVSFVDGATVAVELKKDLQDRGEFHRLLGQVWEYLTEWNVEVLVVLCGNSDPALTKAVERYVAHLNENFKKKVRVLTRLGS